MPLIVAGMENEVQVPAGRTSALIFDSKLRGFFLRVAATGASTYGVDYRAAGKRRRVSLGPTGGATTLTAARRSAETILHKAKLGVDHLEEKQERAKSASQRIGPLIDEFLDERKGALRPKTHSEWSRYLQRYFAPLHRTPAGQLAKRDVIAEIERIAKAHGGASADRAKTALCAFLAWCCESEILEENPALDISRRAKGSPRTRVLEDSEIAEIWRHAGDDDHGQIIRLLLLTACRRDEIAKLKWSEINLEKQQLILPPDRTKNAAGLIQPLSKFAVEIIEAIPIIADKNAVFGLGESGFSGFSRSKARLDGRISKARKSAGAPEIQSWVLHDFRRTVASGMARLGISENICDRILNHTQIGQQSDVARIYQKYNFLPEIAEALEKWSEHLRRTVG
jgi:integrase